MKTDVLEHRLALVERQIVHAEQHITLRRDNLTGLDLVFRPAAYGVMARRRAKLFAPCVTILTLARDG